MERKKTGKIMVAFKLSPELKRHATDYVESLDTDLSKWVRGLVRAYLIEKKVLNKNGELINGWGDPNRMNEKECPRTAELGEVIGVKVEANSPLYFGLKHYATGNTPDAPNMSALLRFLVERELRNEEIINRQGQPTKKWMAVRAQNQAA